MKAPIASRVLVLNPNSTAAMTRAVAQQLALQLPAGSVVHEHTCLQGPAVVDTVASFDAAAQLAPAALAEALARHPDTTAVVLACFGDPGLEALRGLSGGRPVLGLADAALAQASRQHGAYAVLTCGPAWVGLLHQRAAELGWNHELLGVWALPVNGRAWLDERERWQPALQEAADTATRLGAHCLVLGGAVFAGQQHVVQTQLPVIDSIQAVVRALHEANGTPAAVRH